MNKQLFLLTTLFLASQTAQACLQRRPGTPCLDGQSEFLRKERTELSEGQRLQAMSKVAMDRYFAGLEGKTKAVFPRRTQPFVKSHKGSNRNTGTFGPKDMSHRQR